MKYFRNMMELNGMVVLILLIGSYLYNWRYYSDVLLICNNGTFYFYKNGLVKTAANSGSTGTGSDEGI